MFLRTGADSSAIDSLPLNVSGLTGTVRMNIMNEGSYLIRLLDNQGHSNHDPINYHIRLLNDHYPLVRIAFPPGDVVLGDEMKLPLRIEADDDYGVSRLSLAYRIMGQDTTINYTPLNVPTPQVQNVTIEQIWDMSQLQLFLGDVLEYWAIVWDNDVISGPKRGESERRLVSLPSIEEIVSGIEQSEEAGFEQAERTLETARELQEKVSEIIDEMRRNPDMDWEKRRDIESALDQQKEIDQQVDELARRIEDLVERLEKHDLLTAEKLEKYSELQKLIDEISSPELKAAMDKLREAMETQDPDKIRQALEQFDMNREEFLERIERSLNILQQLQLERKMDELVRLTEELLHQQEEIIDQIDRADSENLQQRQESLARSMDVVNNCLKETSQLADKAEEQVLAAELDSLLAFSEETDISGKMSDAAKALSENSMRQARNASEQAARALAELSAALKQSSTELKERRKSQLAGKLRRLAEELLYISKDQEDLAVESHEIGTSSPRYRSLAGQQEDIRQTLQEIIARMFAVSQETFFITPDLGASLGKASTEIEKAIDGFSDRRPRSVASPQQKALGEINRSALKLLNLLSDLESASSSSGYEEMMRQLAEMASQQQGLNDQSMMMPGGDGEQMMPGGSDQLSRMAAQQRALQEAMQQLSEDAEGMQEILGDLEGVAKSMGEVAEDFDDKTIDARTRRLQRQIVSRLLDATRSAKEREYSRRRESKTGRDLTRKPPPALRFDQDREQLRRDLLRAMQEGYTRDYRELIRNYFQALEKLEKQYENQR
ncbi:hypothetical protein HQ587_02505 [bacterium]|nr:hypothetical protein [bacterium]